ncbi:TonB-dependent receptor [Shewanella corallii]|uniref:TonB-dependent receptor n=1 Tax=Shewanella corallii TaxID=560080 RepID=A0ABT0N4C0_9GAMM|nr:TonB-dependent receptor [Shewanella corallii]MCL2913262.1 TonB-dependent receptor [Shewanella corallii]
MEVIEVSARKKVESIQETPLSIAAFNQDSLKSRGIGDISQVADFVSNLTFDSTAPISGSSNAASVFIRGVGQSDFVFTSDPGVGIYLDGVYIARSTGSIFDSMDVDRIEIVRGPQGTLFGKNTIGGAISVVTKKPDEEFSGGAEVTLGNFSHRKFRGYVNVPLTDNWFSRLSVGVNDKDGYGRRLITGQSLGGEEKRSARFSSRWYASDALTFDLSADWSRADEESPVSTLVNNDPDQIGAPTTIFGGLAYNNLIGGNPLAGNTNPALAAFALLPGLPAGTQRYDKQWLTNDLFTSNATGPTGSKYDILGVSLEANLELTDSLSLKSISGFREFDTQFGRDPDGSPLDLVSTYNEMEHHQFSQEFQVSGQAFSDRMDWIVGLYYMEEKGSDRVTVSFAQETFDIYANEGVGCNLEGIGGPNLIPAGICPNIFRVDARGDGTSIDNSSKAVFGEAEYALTDSLDVTLGLRWSEDDKGVDTSGYLIGGAQAIANPVANETFSNVSGRAIARYTWQPNFITYLSYSQGYKSGGFNPRYGLPLPAPTSFKPEEVDTWELGLKADFWDDRARLNFAGFSANYDDIQVVVFDNGIPRTINAAEGRIRGLELDLVLLATEDLTFNLNYGLLDAEYSRLDAAVTGSFGTPIVNPITKDMMFVNTPENSLSVGAQYYLPVGEYGDLNLRVDANYKSKVANDAINTPELIQKGLTLVNMTATYKPHNQAWSVSLYGRNLTDEVYITSGVADKPGFGLVEVNAARPREYGVSISYDF